MRARTKGFAGMGVLLLVVAAGCGGDDDDGSGDASNSIEATATEFQFEPDAWAVTAGEEFTVDFTNDGSVDHEWVIMSEEIASEDEFAEDKVLDEVEVGPGESVNQAFTVDEAGTYQVICALEGHFEGGMEGTLTVE